MGNGTPKETPSPEDSNVEGQGGQGEQTGTGSQNSDRPATLNQELNSIKFDELVLGMGRAIAKAQFELDMMSARIASLLAGGNDSPTGSETPAVLSKIEFGANQYSLLELGFTPTFYQFVDTLIEIKVSFSIVKSRDDSGVNASVDASGNFGVSGFGRVGGELHTSMVGGAFSQKYGYTAEGASLMRTKLVPVPPPALLEERIRETVAKKAVAKKEAAKKEAAGSKTKV